MSCNLGSAHAVARKPKEIQACTGFENEMSYILNKIITDPKVRRSLYLSLVKSHLFYASQVWSPQHELRPISKEYNIELQGGILKTWIGDISYKDYTN